MKRTFAHWLKTASFVLVLGLLIAPVVPVHASEDDATAETTSSFDVWGQLIELSSTEAPTTIVVRENPTGEFTDYTIDIDSETVFGTDDKNTTVMSDWITGDSLHVKGTKNENTGVVTAEVIVNASLNPAKHHGLNGWITAVDTDASTMTVQWNGEEHLVNVTSNTHMVVPPINPAALSDFQLNDRVRLRLIEDSMVENEARIIVALRRGDEIFLKARTRGFAAELTDLDDNGDGTGTLSVTLSANAHLRSDDVNNLVGVEGDELVITYDENTKFVRKFNGEATVDEFVPGDELFIVGRVDDDGSIEARLVKDTSMWRRNVAQHAGKITSIDTSSNTITLEGVGRGVGTGLEVTVEYSDDTEFVERGDESVDESDLEVGNVIRVFGTARRDGSGLTITDVSKVWIANPLKIEDGELDDEDEDTEDSDEESDEDAEDSDEDTEDADDEDADEDAAEDEDTDETDEDSTEDADEETDEETGDESDDSDSGSDSDTDDTDASDEDETTDDDETDTEEETTV